jgi:PPM family protein phosphatase
VIAVDYPHLPIHAGTSTGLVRKTNEDRFTHASYKASETDETPILLAVVADGVGGQNAGEKAALIAVEMIPDYFERNEVANPLKGLENAFLAANREMMHQAELEPDFQGMACTCSAILVIGNHLSIAHVGDSRIYLLQNGRLIQISRDHTWEAGMHFSGHEKGNNTQGNSRSHIISRYLGSELPPKVDVGLYLDEKENEIEAVSHQGLELGKEDLILVCSDGLTDMVSDIEIERIMKESQPRNLVENLTNAALKKGGKDNITMVIIGGSFS